MPPSSIRVTINEREVEIPRARFGLFLELEVILIDMRNKVRARDSGGVVSRIHRYIEVASGEEYPIDGLPWYEVLIFFSALRALNVLDSDTPFSKTQTFKKSDPSPWDYPRRSKVVWAHLLAYNYGWSLKDINDLWPEEAAAFVQEILVEEQLQREWIHSLSSVAHPRDKKGKDLYKPLSRPGWMTHRPRKQRMLRAGLPKGTIINLSGVETKDLDG